MQKTDYAGLIRRTWQDEGLAGAVAKLPLERKFKLETVREVRHPSPPVLSTFAGECEQFWVRWSPGCPSVGVPVMAHLDISGGHCMCYTIVREGGGGDTGASWRTQPHLREEHTSCKSAREGYYTKVDKLQLWSALSSRLHHLNEDPFMVLVCQLSSSFKGRESRCRW